MASSSDRLWSPLKGPADIRLLLVAPAKPRDAIRCCFLPCNLDADYYYFHDPDADAPEHSKGEDLPDPSSGDLTQKVEGLDPQPTRTADSRSSKETPSAAPDPPSYASSDPPSSKDHPIPQSRLVRPVQGFGVAIMKSGEPEVDDLEFMMEMNYNFEVEGEPMAHAFQEYTALSYVWGDPTAQEAIFLDGERLHIQRSLHDAILRVRSQESGRCVWADALCIHQANIPEREAQVRLMSRIYRQAECVVGDVGKAEIQDCANFVVLSKLILRAGKACADMAKGREMNTELEPFLVPTQNASGQEARKTLFAKPPAIRLQDHGLPPDDSNLWKSWHRFLSSPYFQRTWVLQEVALAKKLHLFWGMIGIRNPGEAIGNCVEFIDKFDTASFSRRLAATGDAKQAEAVSAGFQGCATMFRLRAHVNLDRPEPAMVDAARLVGNLDAASSYLRATDTRDKIYSLIGISSDGDSYLKHITYSESTSLVYWRFARLFVESGYGIDLLQQAALNRSKLEGVPSWVPDWSASKVDNQLYGRVFNNFTHADLAGGDRTPQIRMGAHPSRLSVQGIVVDTVVGLGPTLLPSAPSPGSSDQSDTIAIQDIVLFVVKGVLFALKAREWENPENALEAVFRACVQGPPKARADRVDDMWKGFQAVVSKTLAAQEQSEEDGSESMSVYDDYIFAMFWGGGAFARSLCLTERGYLGLVPDRTKVGDQVAIILAGPVPFVLRHANVGEQAEAASDLVGDGYFHGIMQGEALQFPGCEEQEITLV